MFRNYYWYKFKEFIRTMRWAIKHKHNLWTWFKIAIDLDNKSFCYWIKECEHEHYDRIFRRLEKELKDYDNQRANPKVH